MGTQLRWTIAVLALMALGQTAPSFAATTTQSTYVDSSGRVIHCVSTDSGRTYCGTAHTRYVITGSPNPVCVEGKTWGLDDRGVWVSSGCTADFSVAVANAAAAGDTSAVVSTSSAVDSSGRLVHCVSTASGRSYCGAAHTRYVISGNPNPTCIEGKTWGLDDRGVWVSSGCSADFSVAAANAASAGDTSPIVSTSSAVDSSGRIVHCVSTASGRTYCGAHHAHYRFHGTADPVCVEGKTWGFDSRGVWVTGGCKGDFDYDDD
jgi:hypothetical protein